MDDTTADAPKPKRRKTKNATKTKEARDKKNATQNRYRLAKKLAALNKSPAKKGKTGRRFGAQPVVAILQEYANAIRGGGLSVLKIDEKVLTKAAARAILDVLGV